MDIKHGRRKSFDIEFVEVTEDNIQEVADWCCGVIGGEGKDRFIKIIDKGAINPMQTKAFIDDLVVHHLELRTFKKFGRKSFSKSYEEIVAEGRKAQEHDRSAESGQYVSHEEAVADPEHTVHETDLPRDADPS